MAAVGMHDLEVLLCFVQAINLPGLLGNVVHTAPLEIRIAKGRAHKDMARGQSRKHVVKIKRQLIERVFEQARHVAIAGPAGEISVVVVMKCREATARHDRSQPLIECGRE